MNALRAAGDRFQVHDLRWCLRLNRWSHRPTVERLFGVLSRLGDGPVWYLLIAAMPLLDGERGWQASLHLAALGLVSLLLYRGLKRYSRRPRPLHRHQDIRASVAPLDEFSFPSGHTLHAVGFTLVALVYLPWLAVLLLPLAIGIALSRVVLGLHYPSDVLAASAIAVALAESSFLLFS